MTGKIEFELGRVANIVGEGKNAVYHHFLLFPLCFQKATFSGSLKVGIVWSEESMIIQTSDHMTDGKGSKDGV